MACCLGVNLFGHDVRSIIDKTRHHRYYGVANQTMDQDSSFTDLERSAPKKMRSRLRSSNTTPWRRRFWEDLTDVRANAKPSAGERNESGTGQQLLGQQRVDRFGRFQDCGQAQSQTNFNNRGQDSADIQQLHPKRPKPWSSDRPFMAQHIHRLDSSKYLAMGTFAGLTVGQTSINEALGSAYRSGHGAGGGVSIDWVGARGRHWSLGIGFYEFVQVMEHQMSVDRVHQQ